jgi:putative holliday junction resolvase
VKVLAVDPGEKRIGIAVSDPTGTLARPLCIIKHRSREWDALAIVSYAKEEGAAMIVVGQAFDSNGEVGPQARKSQRLADAIQSITELSVRLWDESGTTRAAIRSRVEMGVSRKKRRGHLDDVAASALLQEFLIENEALVHEEGLADG